VAYSPSIFVLVFTVSIQVNARKCGEHQAPTEFIMIVSLFGLPRADLGLPFASPGRVGEVVLWGVITREEVLEREGSGV
jgi:hypothetical protein